MCISRDSMNQFGAGRSRGRSHQWLSVIYLVADVPIASCGAYGSYHEAFDETAHQYLRSPLAGVERTTFARAWRFRHLVAWGMRIKPIDWMKTKHLG
jgi:hypothetical protein